MLSTQRKAGSNTNRLLLAGDEMEEFEGGQEDEEGDNNPFDNDGSRQIKPEKDNPLQQNLVGNGSFCTSVKALLTKRFLVKKRDKFGIICETVVPILLVIVGSLLMLLPLHVDSPSYVVGRDENYPSAQNLVIY